MSEETAAASNGFSVLDGVSFVAGGAVASVHVRGVISDDLTGAGWIVLAGTFAWVSLTAAGPFIYVVRRYARRLYGYPQVGDRLWAMLGLPWFLTALLQTTPDRSGATAHGLVALGLSVGLAIASLIALVVVWTTWVRVTPEQAAETFAPPWTNRVGLTLVVAWPVQCGLAMVVIG